MMPETEGRNPFEDHIESDAFDISELGIAGDPAQLQEQLNTLLNSLPQPLDYRLWDEELDDLQKQLSIHLAGAVIERYLRVHHQEELSELSDDELLMMMNVPLTLAMIVQQRLHATPRSAPVALVARATVARPPETLPQRPPPAAAPTLLQRMQHLLKQVRSRLERLLNPSR
ncbi:MAG: hypothetical protein MUE40_14290 [Anaerolineae bacterium]|jgi:hypothetical protein|nr:hypothetical protein [Anaerolineae bacterium]